MADVSTVEHALETLPASFGRGIRLVALRALGDADDAEDVVQETMIRLLQAVREGRASLDLPLTHFAYGIARNVIGDFRRRRARENHHVARLYEERLEPPSLLQLAAQRDECERVRKALTRLWGADRRLLERLFYDGMRVAELARETGEPPERLRKRKSRALEKLRNLLDRDR